MSLRVDLRSRRQEFLDVQCWLGIIIVHSLYIMVVNGGLSQCCFNGPTSRNVAGIYWLSDVYCNLLLLGIVAVSFSRSWACRTIWQGHNIGFEANGPQPFSLGVPKKCELCECGANRLLSSLEVAVGNLVVMDAARRKDSPPANE